MTKSADFNNQLILNLADNIFTAIYDIGYDMSFKLIDANLQWIETVIVKLYKMIASYP